MFFISEKYINYESKYRDYVFLPIEIDYRYIFYTIFSLIGVFIILNLIIAFQKNKKKYFKNFIIINSVMILILILYVVFLNNHNIINFNINRFNNIIENFNNNLINIRVNLKNKYNLSNIREKYIDIGYNLNSIYISSENEYIKSYNFNISLQNFYNDLNKFTNILNNNIKDINSLLENQKNKINNYNKIYNLINLNSNFYYYYIDNKLDLLIVFHKSKYIEDFLNKKIKNNLFLSKNLLLQNNNFIINTECSSIEIENIKNINKNLISSKNNKFYQLDSQLYNSIFMVNNISFFIDVFNNTIYYKDSNNNIHYIDIFNQLDNFINEELINCIINGKSVNYKPMFNIKNKNNILISQLFNFNNYLFKYNLINNTNNFNSVLENLGISIKN